MNFNNLPTQLIALLLGWMFTLYLQSIANRRTEALKRKDKIVDQLDGLSKWVETEITKKNFSPELTEEAFTGILLQIELRINQFNNHVGKKVVSIDQIGLLRDIDFYSEKKDVEQAKRTAVDEDRPPSNLPYDVKQICSTLIEDIELTSDRLYFPKSMVSRINSFLAEIYGLIVALVAIAMCILLGDLVTSRF